VLSIILVFSLPVEAYKYNNESYHVDLWCKYGTVEYKNTDNTRVDCLTDVYAIEFDFANKYAEAIGQSLHYALMTNKKAGIVLIMTSKNSHVYYNRMIKIISTYNLPITVWTMKAVYN